MSAVYAILVRHGDYLQQTDTPSAHQPHPLSALGCEQATQAATQLAQWLDQENWRLCPQLHSSTLLRAWQTASLMQKQLALLGHRTTVQQYDALCERSVGALANLSSAEIARTLAQDPRCPTLPPNWKSDAHFRLPVPGAESLQQAGARVAQHLRETMRAVLQQHGENHVQVFVGHGASIRHAAQALGVLHPGDIPKLSMHHASLICLKWSPASDRWSHHRGDWKIRPGHESVTD